MRCDRHGAVVILRRQVSHNVTKAQLRAVPEAFSDAGDGGNELMLEKCEGVT